MTLAALSTALLVAPVAYHRLLFRRHEKESLVRVTNVLAIAGLVTVGLAVSCAVLLVVSFVAPGAPAIVITAIVGVRVRGTVVRAAPVPPGPGRPRGPEGQAGAGRHAARPAGPAGPAHALSERDRAGVMETLRVSIPWGHAVA